MIRSYRMIGVISGSVMLAELPANRPAPSMSADSVELHGHPAKAGQEDECELAGAELARSCTRASFV